MSINNGSGVVTADSNSSVTYSGGGSNSQLNAAANTIVFSGESVDTNYQPKLYMYSKDAGKSMSDDPTGATHIGFLKYPNTIYSIPTTVLDYNWIPLS